MSDPVTGNPPEDLTRALRARLGPDGALSVHDYMGLCLAHYYARGTAFGRDGDFITAPEITQMFGELLGLWSAVVWQMMGSPASLRLVEMGPGRGTLMADALRALAPVPPYRAALSVHLVETSPSLRNRQKAALADSGVPIHWHDSISDVPDGPMILLANELLDALPIRQWVRGKDGTVWHERLVVPAPDDAGRPFAFALGAPQQDLPPHVQPAHAAAGPGDIVETCPAAHAIIASVAGRLKTQGGAALFIDYGPARSAPGDSLQAVRGHAFADPLEAPGLADLTAHVDFEALARTAAANGAAVDGVIQQGPFLQGLGLEARAAQLIAGQDSSGRRKITSAVRRLIDPEEMGTLFKGMALRSVGLPSLPGFHGSSAQ